MRTKTILERVKSSFDSLEQKQTENQEKRGNRRKGDTGPKRRNKRKGGRGETEEEQEKRRNRGRGEKEEHEKKVEGRLSWKR